jgi:peptidoglycan/LPS O-acetylase OafA/YrhL
MARLAPPYMLTVLACVALFSIYNWRYGRDAFMEPRWDWLLCSFSYTCYPLGLPTYVVVGWSLEIEVQFYLLAALLVPLVVKYGRAAGWGLGVMLLPAAFLLPHYYALRYSAPFLLGMVTVAYRRGAVRGALYWLVSLGLAAYWGAHLREPETGIVLALGAAAIALRVEPPRVLVWLGGISYSLYLVHAEVGARSLSALRWLGAPMDGLLVWGWIAVGIAASILAAAAMHRLVERPAIRWSHRFGARSPHSSG